MRSAVVIALLACAVPAAAQEELEELAPAPEEEEEEAPAQDDVAAPAQDEFEDAAAELDDVWNLDDGQGAELAWDSFDPAAHYLPRGIVHLGVQLRVGGVFGGRAPVPDGPLGDLGVFVDLRFSPRGPLRMRIGLAVSAQAFDERNRGSGMWEASSPVAIRARVTPIGVDITDWIAIRPTVDLGAQWTRRPDNDSGEWSFFFALSGEAMLRLLDGTLEVGIFGGFQLTGIGVTSRGPYYYGDNTPQAALGVTSAWMFW